MLGNTSINIDKKYYSTYKKLCKTEKGKEENKVFTTMWELFVWCAIFGFLNNKNTKIRDHYSPFRWHNIGHKHQELLLIFALQEEENFGIVKNEKRIQEIVETYANGGMQVVQEQMAKDNKAYTKVESLIDTILDHL